MANISNLLATAEGNKGVSGNLMRNWYVVFKVDSDLYDGIVYIPSIVNTTRIDYYCQQAVQLIQRLRREWEQSVDSQRRVASNSYNLRFNVLDVFVANTDVALDIMEERNAPVWSIYKYDGEMLIKSDGNISLSYEFPTATYNIIFEQIKLHDTSSDWSDTSKKIQNNAAIVPETNSRHFYDYWYLIVEGKGTDYPEPIKLAYEIDIECIKRTCRRAVYAIRGEIEYAEEKLHEDRLNGYLRPKYTFEVDDIYFVNAKEQLPDSMTMSEAMMKIWHSYKVSGGIVIKDSDGHVYDINPSISDTVEQWLQEILHSRDYLQWSSSRYQTGGV